MIAVDTNILVRLMVQDDTEQAQHAENLFTTQKIFIPDTVILETEWVLRFAYELAAKDIHTSLTNLFGLENVYVRDELAVQQALVWFEKGMDFADAWHLSLSQQYTRFATFDRKLIKRATNFGNCQPFCP